MADWRTALRHIAVEAETHFDHLKTRLENRLGRRPIIIQPYLGYGTPESLWLKGRVLEDKGITQGTDNDTLWKNLHNMYLRLNSDEIPRALVRGTFGDIQQTVIADDEGYFEVTLYPGQPIPPGWGELALDLLAYPGTPELPEPVQAPGKVLVPPATAHFGVISDIDDTVLQSSITDLLRLARNVFLGNAHTRLPFAGVAAFYRALQGDPQNPIFYLSSSPWNLYDLLVDFFEIRRIPLGPLLLSDMGLSPLHLVKSPHMAHKLAWIRRLLAAYPDLPFILIGDSGQHDPEIYLEAAREHPGRILAIYIRDASLDRRDDQVRELIGTAGNVPMLLMNDTREAALHAAEHGYIDPDTLPEIEQECAADHDEPPPLETLLNPDSDPL